jgi:hypothetical protein
MAILLAAIKSMSSFCYGDQISRPDRKNPGYCISTSSLSNQQGSDNHVANNICGPLADPSNQAGLFCRVR